MIFNLFQYFISVIVFYDVVCLMFDRKKKFGPRLSTSHPMPSLTAQNGVLHLGAPVLHEAVSLGQIWVGAPAALNTTGDVRGVGESWGLGHWFFVPNELTPPSHRQVRGGGSASPNQPVGHWLFCKVQPCGRLCQATFALLGHRLRVGRPYVLRVASASA